MRPPPPSSRPVAGAWVAAAWLARPDCPRRYAVSSSAMVLISAHRCGASGRPAFENSRAGLERALSYGAEYVEFDVQRCADGTFVIHHDDTVAHRGAHVAIAALTYAELCTGLGEVLRYEDALGILAGHKLGHIDLKFTSPPELYGTPELTWEVQAARLARQTLGDGGFIITSLEDRSVRAVRTWAESCAQEVDRHDADERHTDDTFEGARRKREAGRPFFATPLLVGLSVGRSLAGTPWLKRPVIRWNETGPAQRVTQSDANLIAGHRRLARLGLAGWTARQGIPLLVWTVDDPREIRKWLSDPRVWLLSTNEPELACRIRTELEGQIGALPVN